MRRGAKRIDPSLRSQISNIKQNIRFSKGSFDGTGYPFKQAITELRNEGLKIKYNRTTAMYKVERVMEGEDG